MSRLSVMLCMPIVHHLLGKGCSPKPLYQQLQIPEHLLTDPDNTIDSAKYDRFMEGAAHICDDPHFGLHLGTDFSLDHLGLTGYILLSSNTLAHAFQNYQRYHTLLCSGIDCELHVKDNEAKFSFRLNDFSRKPSRHLLDSVLSSTYKIFQKLTGDPLQLLKRVSFMQSTPADVQPYIHLFGPNLAFSQAENALVFDATVLDLPVVYRNQQLLQMMENHAGQVMRALNLQQSFSEMVSHAMIEKLDGTIPRIQDIARSLGYSVRSLQLQLHKEGTTFKDLLAMVRKNMAESYLKNPAFSITDISYALGFSDPVSFHLAFKKWTGQTPGNYRKQHME